MKFIKDCNNLKLNNTVVTVGKFDCFHLGHKLLLDVANEYKQQGLEIAVLTFDVYPTDVVGHHIEKRVISRSERDYIYAKNNADYFIEYPFTDETKNMEAESFVREVLIEKLGCKALVCGDDFRFGKDRRGDIQMLGQLSRECGFDLKVVKRLEYNGQIISSSLIKEKLQAGNLKDVNYMLGRPFSMAGFVTSGCSRGTKMNFPTINFSVPEDKMLPPDGVYATKTRFGPKEFLSITNVGVRPTFFEKGERVVETNILDFSSDVYGQKAVVEFYTYLRPEAKFTGEEELKKQIENDINEVRKYFEEI